MRVTDNVYVLSGSYYGAVGNRDTLGDVYGIRTTEGIILIDCGNPDTGIAMIRESLDYYRIADPITHLIITHAHHDHCGSARSIQEAGALVIAGAEDERQCVGGGLTDQKTPFEFSHAFPPFKPDIAIGDECEMNIGGISFRFYKTPGHTPGSMSVFVELDNKKILFTGDALQPAGGQLDSVSFGWQGDVGFSRKSVVSSMMKLMTVDVDVILPGHGKVCLRNGNDMIRFAAQTAYLTMR